ncbi:MAG: serine hydrolase domain-containing protein [Pseudomonadota bacterium]
MNLNPVHEIIAAGLTDRVFTAAVLKVDYSGEPIIHRAFGHRGDSDEEPVGKETLFDLASLTKVLATTPCWMILAGEIPGILDRGLCSWVPRCPSDNRDITPRLLLAHAAGLPAWRPYYLHRFDGSVSDAVLRKILGEQLDYPPGHGCIYSDLGFMLLAFLLEIETGMTLEELARERVFKPLGLLDDLMFRPTCPPARPALTRHGDPAGFVNDLNSRALGGMAGHAGLFGTARGVSALFDEYRRSTVSGRGLFDRALSLEFFTRTAYAEGCTRALGFDTPSAQGSSGGSLFSPQSIGHTGFTGTSVWMDLRRQLSVVLLTNRVIMGEADQRIKAFRPRLHDAIVEGVLS